MTTKLDRLAEEITGPLPVVEGSWSEEHAEEAWILGKREGVAVGFKKAIEEAKTSAIQETLRTKKGYWCSSCRDYIGRKIVRHLESFTEEEKS